MKLKMPNETPVPKSTGIQRVPNRKSATLTVLNKGSASRTMKKTTNAKDSNATTANAAMANVPMESASLRMFENTMLRVVTKMCNKCATDTFSCTFSIFPR